MTLNIMTFECHYAECRYVEPLVAIMLALFKHNMNRKMSEERKTEEMPQFE
jgi:hypothetical protein